MEGRFDRPYVMDSVKSFQQAIKKRRGWGGWTLLAFFHDYSGNWKSYLRNSEANSWREMRCPKHLVSAKSCSEFCSLQTKSEQMPDWSSTLLYSSALVLCCLFWGPLVNRNFFKFPTSLSYLTFLLNIFIFLF